MLPKGITGFGDKTVPPLFPLDPSPFRTLCYAAARLHGGAVASFDTDLVGENFYWARLQIRNASFFLLENGYHPWLALAEKMEWGQISFSDFPYELPFTDPSFRLLTKKELHQPWQNHVSRLGTAEITQIRYWKPATIGEIIFHFWD